jgi:ABC-type branched-subunit amino acid transport system permease subunit
LLYLAKPRISRAAAFNINWTSCKIIMAAIGGVKTPAEPIARALVYFVLCQ